MNLLSCSYKQENRAIATGKSFSFSTSCSGKFLRFLLLYNECIFLHSCSLGHRISLANLGTCCLPLQKPKVLNLYPDAFFADENKEQKKAAQHVAEVDDPEEDDEE